MMTHVDKPNKKTITVKKPVNTNVDQPCSSNLDIKKPYARARAWEQKNYGQNPHDKNDF